MQYQMPLNTEYEHGFKSDLKFRLVITFLEKWGMVAGHSEREDSAGRAVTDLVPVDQTVERAFIMADLVVTEAERRGWLAPLDESPEEVHEFVGKMVGIRGKTEMNIQWPDRSHTT